MANDMNPSENQASNRAAAKQNAKPKRERKFQEVTNDLPPVWDPEEDGSPQTIEGIYVGHREIKTKRNRPFKTWILQNEDTGELLSFSGAIADRKMARLPKGTYCRVTYQGRVDTQSGDAKMYKVEAEEGARLLDETEVLA